MHKEEPFFDTINLLWYQSKPLFLYGSSIESKITVLEPLKVSSKHRFATGKMRYPNGVLLLLSTGTTVTAQLKQCAADNCLRGIVTLTSQFLRYPITNL